MIRKFAQLARQFGRSDESGGELGDARVEPKLAADSIVSDSDSEVSPPTDLHVVKRPLDTTCSVHTNSAAVELE